MKKYLLILTVVALFTTSCCEDAQKNENANNTDVIVVDEVTTLSLANFDDKVGDFVGKQIQLEGTVDHICQHGGQKLFLVSEDSDARVKIVPDEEIAAFNTDLEGDNIVLVGIVEEQRIDEAYLKEWEEEIKAGMEVDDKGEGIHTKEESVEGCEYSEEPEEMKKVNHLREMIKESGSDHLSFYSVLCTSYDVVENNDNDDDHDHDDDDQDHEH